MDLRKIEPEDFNSFMAEIDKIRSDVHRTQNLTWFYVNARFRMDKKQFINNHHVDGKDDGGLDCLFKEGNTFYLIQAKYHSRPVSESFETIRHELQKIEKTIIGENTNVRSTEFINELKRELKNQGAYLEIIWLTTNSVSEGVTKKASEHLESILYNRGWEINADINFIDRYSLESVIYDIKHGYVPHTGKKQLKLEPGEYMTVSKERNNIEAIVCNVKVVELLKWFKSYKEITTFLQKNVRESVGESAINKSMKKSFASEPSLFWYKHNGIIVFADWFETDKSQKQLSLRNPQIVNGAQTVSQLYKAYDENRNDNSPAKVLLRVYRLPYEDAETYKRSIDIIAALNSQNKIKASDLHSTDPRQVMLENRIDDLGLQFRYFRKRTDSGRVSGWYNIFMNRLAYIFHVCHYRKPDEGISGSIESYFEEDKRYDECFPENLIKKPINHSLDHIVFNYLESWYLYYIVDRYLFKELNKKHQELFNYVSWYTQVDTYTQQQHWKETHFKGTWREWMDFMQSKEYINGIIKYMKPRYIIQFGFMPKSEVDPRNFYKSKIGRDKFYKNQGNYLLFKKEIGRVYELFKRNNGY